MVRGVIFDLDLTLVDTTSLERARKLRHWQDAYSLIPSTTMYPGIKEVLETLKEKGIKMAIVSSSPKPYVERLVNFHQIPVNYIVGYHDAHPIKPHPAPMLKALSLMNEKAENVVSFGDRAIDIQSSKGAGITSIACLWGTKEREVLLRSPYSHVIHNTSDILKYAL